MKIEHLIDKVELALLRVLADEVKAMHKADDEHGCGFYNSPQWRQHYESTRELVGLPEQE
jgi:hypothetical protein